MAITAHVRLNIERRIIRNHLMVRYGMSREFARVISNAHSLGGPIFYMVRLEQGAGSQQQQFKF